MHARTTTQARALAALAVIAAIGMLLACTTLSPQTMMTGATPAWACPSPTPQPYGEAGPVKGYTDGDALPTSVPSGPLRHKQIPVYYAQWEQEYGDEGGPPFPSPTPYVVQGNIYSFGQRVRIAPLFVVADARASGSSKDGRQLYLIELTWLNPTIAPIPVSYASQVRLRSVRLPDGGEISGDEWRVSTQAMQQAGIGELPKVIPLGESRITLPIVAPAGEPSVVEVTLRRDTSYAPAYSVTGTPAPTVTPTPPVTPTPNTDLRAVTRDDVVVAFSVERPAGPPCDDPGAVTPWDTGGIVPSGEADVPLQAPSGSGRLIEIALAQVGKRYVWGAAGPDSFDCSGLVVWSYSQIGQRIPGRTAEEQFRRMRPISASAALPGDTLYFNPSGDPRMQITHAAIYLGDINGDGVGDVIHAASPKYGVLLMRGGLTTPYYFGADCQLCLAGFRTMR